MIPKNLKQLPREREDKTQFLWRRGYRISEFPTADCDRIELLFAMFNPILYKTKFIFRLKPSPKHKNGRRTWAHWTRQALQLCYLHWQSKCCKGNLLIELINSFSNYFHFPRQPTPPSSWLLWLWKPRMQWSQSELLFKMVFWQKCSL